MAIRAGKMEYLLGITRLDSISVHKHAEKDLANIIVSGYANIQLSVYNTYISVMKFDPNPF